MQTVYFKATGAYGFIGISHSIVSLYTAALLPFSEGRGGGGFTQAIQLFAVMNLVHQSLFGGKLENQYS